MNDAIKAVADRLKGLREIMDVSVEEAAKVCGITPEQYEAYETGTIDIPVGILHSMAREYNFELTTLYSLAKYSTTFLSSVPNLLMSVSIII